MSRAFRILIAGFLAISAASCSKPSNVTGTAFVVTAGQGSYRLALAPVLALSEEKMAKVKSEYDKALTSKIAALKAEVEEANGQLASLRNQLETAEVAVQTAKARIIDAENRGSVFRPQPASDRNPFGFTDTTDGFLETLLSNLRDKEAAYNSVLSRSNDCSKELETLTEPSAEAPSWLRDKFVALLGNNGVVIAKTDADGKFDAILPDNVRYLVCLSQRQVVDDTESYTWVVDLTKEASFKEQRKVDFNNDNLTKVTTGLLNLWLP